MRRDGDDIQQPYERAAGAWQEVAQVVIDVATYIGAAGITGVIGNRVDARVRSLFASVRDRWRARARADGDALTEEEAVDAATAAVIAVGYPAADVEPVDKERRPDGSWVVILRSGGDTLRASVPAGDPAEARILVV